MQPRNVPGQLLTIVNFYREIVRMIAVKFHTQKEKTCKTATDLILNEGVRPPVKFSKKFAFRSPTRDILGSVTITSSCFHFILFLVFNVRNDDVCESLKLGVMDEI